MNREIPARAIFSPSYRNYNMKNIRNEREGKLREQEEEKSEFIVTTIMDERKNKIIIEKKGRKKNREFIVLTNLM